MRFHVHFQSREQFKRHTAHLARVRLFVRVNDCMSPQMGDVFELFATSIADEGELNCRLWSVLLLVKLKVVLGVEDQVAVAASE